MLSRLAEQLRLERENPTDALLAQIRGVLERSGRSIGQLEGEDAEIRTDWELFEKMVDPDTDPERFRLLKSAIIVDAQPVTEVGFLGDLLEKTRAEAEKGREKTNALSRGHGEVRKELETATARSAGFAQEIAQQRKLGFIALERRAAEAVADEAELRQQRLDISTLEDTRAQNVAPEIAEEFKTARDGVQAKDWSKELQLFQRELEVIVLQFTTDISGKMRQLSYAEMDETQRQALNGLQAALWRLVARVDAVTCDLNRMVETSTTPGQPTVTCIPPTRNLRNAPRLCCWERGHDPLVLRNYMRSGDLSSATILCCTQHMEEFMTIPWVDIILATKVTRVEEPSFWQINFSNGFRR